MGWSSFDRSRHRLDQGIAAARRTRTTYALRRELALIDERLAPVGQRIFGHGCTLGIELLFRWRSDNGELVLPSSFLPRVREAGLMHLVNEAMLTHAVRFAAASASLAEPPFVSFNLSAEHLGAPGFARRVDKQLASLDVSPDRLMIEITESEYVTLDEAWYRSVRNVQSLGVKLAIDDFGSGYSSIERLRHMPATHIKFDRLLVHAATGPFGNIAEGVARFAAISGIDIIAEGIETIVDLEAMETIGVRAFQGFLLEQPLRLGNILNELHAQQRPLVAAPAV